MYFVTVWLSGFGSIGKVTGYGKDNKTVSVEVALEAPDTLFGHKIVQIENDQYIDSYAAAKMLKMSTKTLGSISSSVYCAYSTDPATGAPGGKCDLGLRIKFTGKELVVVGYVRRVNDVFQYSQLAIKAIAQYKKAFPRLFHFLEHADNARSYALHDVFPDENEHTMLRRIDEWKVQVGVQVWLLHSSTIVLTVLGAEIEPLPL